MYYKNGDYYLTAVHIKKPVEVVFNYVTDISRFHEWRIGDSKYLKPLEKNFWQVDIPEFSALFKKQSFLKVISNSQKKTIDWYWGPHKENLYCYQPMRIISAAAPINQEGSIVLWSGFRHPALDKVIADVQPAVSEISLMNLKMSLEKAKDFDQNDINGTNFTVHVGRHINVPIDYAFRYISDTNNLPEWTILCRHLKQVDKDVWYGMASGYASKGLYYKTIIDTEAKLLTWHCGLEKDKLTQFMPTMFYPAKQAVGKDGAFFIWTGFRNPKLPSRIPTYMHDIHTFEISSLKKVLENKYISSTTGMQHLQSGADAGKRFYSTYRDDAVTGNKGIFGHRLSFFQPGRDNASPMLHRPIATCFFKPQVIQPQFFAPPRLSAGLIPATAMALTTKVVRCLK